MSSPASKKKKKFRPNAYWCFLQEQQKLHRLWHLTKEDREARISEMWKNVDAEGRERYKRRAESMRSGSSAGSSSSSSSSRPEPPLLVAPPAPILSSALRKADDQPSQPPPSKKPKILKDSLGESIEEREKREAEAEAKAYKKLMEEKVKKIIESAAEDEVIFNKNFHLISAVTFSHDPTGVVYPAEIAFGKFSLFKGIHQRLHKKVNPGRLPANMEMDALDKSHEQHKYPLPDDNDDDKTDFINLVHQILEFLQPEAEIPIFYAREKDVPEIKKALDMIFTRCGEGSETLDVIHVYSVERFLKVLSENVQNMRNAGVDVDSNEYQLILASFSVASAISEFQRFRPYEPCDFHSKNRAEDFCALAAVNGIGYLLAEVCCDKRHIEMIEGQHKPKKNRNGQELADDDFTDI